jgi:predicted enzyme related to lactoylglutathione lyase
LRTATTTRARNGVRHGDISYVTLRLPDPARGQAFYGAVLGWRFSPGNSEHGVQVDDIVPMMGLWAGAGPPGAQVRGAVLGYRVSDIASAVAAVRGHGGTMSDPHREPYGLAAEGHDDQGMPVYLHELPPVAGGLTSTSEELHNGEVQGDVSYLTMVVSDLEAARAFYAGVLGWTVNVGRLGGAQVSGVAPQIGMTTKPEAGAAAPGVILCHRVDDIRAAVQRVRDAGGAAREVAKRPYGLESLCADDQGTPFYLHQL